jgi:hypothetical protein
MQLEGAQQSLGKIVAVDARPGSEFDILMVAVVKGGVRSQVRMAARTAPPR